MTTHLEYLKTKLAMLEESPTNAGAAELVREEIKAEEKAQADAAKRAEPKSTKPKDQPKEGAE